MKFSVAVLGLLIFVASVVVWFATDCDFNGKPLSAFELLVSFAEVAGVVITAIGVGWDDIQNFSHD